MRDAEGLFRALADEERLRIMGILLSQREGACVCELVDALRIPQYQVSRQLGTLRDVGLVSGEKRGTWVYYGISPSLPPLAEAVIEALAAHVPNTRRDDLERFSRRLLLREQGICTIGYLPDARYRESIPVNVSRSGEDVNG